MKINICIICKLKTKLYYILKQVHLCKIHKHLYSTIYLGGSMNPHLLRLWSHCFTPKFIIFARRQPKYFIWPLPLFNILDQACSIVCHFNSMVSLQSCSRLSSNEQCMAVMSCDLIVCGNTNVVHFSCAKNTVLKPYSLGRVLYFPIPHSNGHVCKS